MYEGGRRVALGLYRSGHQRHILEDALGLGVADLDTSFNYFQFSSHRRLAEVAGDLLPRFSISTKVGYFPSSAGTVHSIEPSALREAIGYVVQDLTVLPHAILLHNPESSMGGSSPSTAQSSLLRAFEVLAQARDEGTCVSWGVATWRPQLLLQYLGAGYQGPLPEILMTRSGVLASAQVLKSAEVLRNLWGISEEGSWGMSPFGGMPNSDLWSYVNCRTFIRTGQGLTNLQAAFRLAFDLPKVARVAVGANRSEHLKMLVDALPSEVDDERLIRYRRLLETRGSV